MMKYRCLVFDHDDTVVDSSRNIHYPSYLGYMELHHPDRIVSLEDYMRYNFAPGVAAFFRDICGLTETEMEEEHDYWLEYTTNHIASAFPRMKEIMEKHQAAGGIIAVVSHSYRKNILRDYAYNNLPEPDAVFGWDMEPEKRKPSPYPVEEVMRRFCLKKEEVLVIDDLKPGLDMARAAGVDFAAAGWCFAIEENVVYMKQHADFYLEKEEELENLLFPSL